MSKDRIVLVDGARTPVRSFGGSLAAVPAHELGAGIGGGQALGALFRRV